MLEDALKFGYSFPYLYDKTQEVAKAYHAACTPDFFLFDKDKKLFTEGRWTGAVRETACPSPAKTFGSPFDALLAGQPLFFSPETQAWGAISNGSRKRTGLFFRTKLPRRQSSVYLKTASPFFPSPQVVRGSASQE